MPGRATYYTWTLPGWLRFAVLNRRSGASRGVGCTPRPRSHAADASPRTESTIHREECRRDRQRVLRRGQLSVSRARRIPARLKKSSFRGSKHGLRVGEDFFLGLSPERGAPGSREFDISRIPKLVGGVTPRRS